MSKAVIINCDCTSEFQDAEHGKGRRVANVQDKTHDKLTGKSEAVCTVCGKSSRSHV